MRRGMQKTKNWKIQRICLLLLFIAIELSACSKGTDENGQIEEMGSNVVETYISDESMQQDETESPDTESDEDMESESLAETEAIEYPLETVYTDEEHNLITYGGINYDISYFHLVKIVEEENRTTFIAEMDAKFRELESADASVERTYIFTQEPNFSIEGYQEAMQYFSLMSDYHSFRSYLENTEDGIRALYMASNDDKSYYLIALTGEEGFYFIEAENDNSVDRSIMGYASEYREYEYDLSELECGQGYTVQIETGTNYRKQRAEYKVTSELLSYAGELQIMPSENQDYDFVKEMKITNIEDGGQWKESSVSWFADYGDANDFPEFINVNGDGYPDFRVCVGHGTRNTWYIIFVWDTESGKYVQVEEDGTAKGKAEYLRNKFDEPIFHDGYLEQVFGDSTTRVYQLFQLVGNKLVLVEENIDVYNEELGEWVDYGEE